jgi:hypothetical protein
MVLLEAGLYTIDIDIAEALYFLQEHSRKMQERQAQLSALQEPTL